MCHYKTPRSGEKKGTVKKNSFFGQWVEGGGRNVRTGSKKAIFAGHIPKTEAGNWIYRIIVAAFSSLNAKIMPKISLHGVQTYFG